MNDSGIICNGFFVTYSRSKIEIQWTCHNVSSTAGPFHSAGNQRRIHQNWFHPCFFFFFGGAKTCQLFLTKRNAKNRFHFIRSCVSWCERWPPAPTPFSRHWHRYDGRMASQPAHTKCRSWSIAKQQQCFSNTSRSAKIYYRAQRAILTSSKTILWPTHGYNQTQTRMPFFQVNSERLFGEVLLPRWTDSLPFDRRYLSQVPLYIENAILL